MEKVTAKVFRVGLAFLFGVGLALLPQVAAAATLYFSPSSGSYTVGSAFSVSIYVSSAEQAMNAASGVISFPQDKLNVTSFSKSGSIFTLWVQELSFSNSAGTINFEGIVLNPGFSGVMGKIFTANFRVKAAGVVNLNFSSGSVLANDGKGTNILASLESASFSLKEEAVPPEIMGTPTAPQISSPAHPDSDKWYAIRDAKFTWPVLVDVTGARLLVGRAPLATPTVVYTPSIREREITNLDDGIWYFHVQLRNAIGWGGITHFKFQIDTQPPKPFVIEVKEGEKTNNPQPTLVFETTDEMSGVDYYEVKIDQQESIKTAEKEYKLPTQSLGKHTIIIKAVDKAQNYTPAIAEIEILPIETPIITDYPQTLFSGVTLSIKGTAVSEVKVKVYIQKNDREVRIDETKSDKEGKWSYIGTEFLENGIYKVWAESIDYLGARSKPSEKVTIQVTLPVFIRIGKLAIDYLTTIITLLVLIGVIISAFIWFWRKIIRKRRKLRKEVTEAEKTLYRALKDLKEEIEEQVAKLDGEPGLSKKEKEICKDLKKALETSEKLIGKEIKDIEKELE